MTNHEPECVMLKRRGAEYVARLLSKEPKYHELDFWAKRTKLLCSKQKHSKKYSIASALDTHHIIAEKHAEYNSNPGEKSIK